MFLNVRPLLLRPIPWGWKNKKTSHGLFVTSHPGKIQMPNLSAHFDWNRFEILLSPESWGNPSSIGTLDMKSIFTTAIRFLGWEAAWIGLEYEKLDLTPITEAFLTWNEKLLKVFRGCIKYFMIGDDYGYNRGLFVSREAWRSQVKPHLKRLIDLAKNHYCTVILHTDGDVFLLLDDFRDLKIDILSYERVGRMKNLGTYYYSLKLWESIPDLNPREYN